MRKIVFVILHLIFIVTGCYNTEIIEIPKGYIEKKEYFDEDGFQDYTDYAKYVYPSKEVVINNKEYKKISEDDIDNVKGYFENFSSWMEMSGRINQFDIDLNIINEGDYVKIKTKEGKKMGNGQYGKYDNYSIYFFDIETLTLYYIHNNI